MSGMIIAEQNIKKIIYILILHRIIIYTYGPFDEKLWREREREQLWMVIFKVNYPPKIMKNHK